MCCHPSALAVQMEGPAGSLAACVRGEKKRVFGVEDGASPRLGRIARLWVSPAFQYRGRQSRLGYSVLQLVCREPRTELFSVLSLLRSNTPASGVSTVCLGVSCFISQLGVPPVEAARGRWWLVWHHRLSEPHTCREKGSKASWLLI